MRYRCLKKRHESVYKEYIDAAKECTANRVYPLSIANGIQTGEIYTDGMGSVLFLHYCGFAYISGVVNPGFLEEIYQEFLVSDTDRRFLLITDSHFIIDYYKDRDLIQLDRRVEYNHIRVPEKPQIPDDRFLTERITADNIGYIQGRIIPSFSWQSADAFLERGFGYLVRKDSEFSAVAFTSAVSPEEVDIGVETAEAHRHHGLASYLAYRMCEEIIQQGRRPVWAHAETNAGSQKTALSVGFKPCRINTVIHK
jgi:hypothetical protein